MAKTGARDTPIRYVEVGKPVISPYARIYESTRGSKLAIGADTHVMEFVVIKFVGGHGDIEIGERCYINPHSVLYSGSGIKIGNDVLIGPGVMIVPANHAFDNPAVPIAKQGFMPSRGGVVIEDNAWIGAGCVLLDGAHVRSGTVVGAGSVISGEVGPGRWVQGRLIVGSKI